MLNRLLPVFIMSLVTVSGHAQQFGDIVRDAGGNIRFMVQSSEYMRSIGEPLPTGQLGALEYCASQGMRLPSAREFAQLAASMGASGISEIGRGGDYGVWAKNADGQIDNFYFSHTGYTPPAGDLGTYEFWSSSASSFNSNYGNIFSGKYGYVDDSNYRVATFAVRCVSWQ